MIPAVVAGKRNSQVKCNNIILLLTSYSNCCTKRRTDRQTENTPLASVVK